MVVDDALMGVTEVVRGADLLSSTPRQLWLYRELGLQAPQFYHLPLLLDHEGRRLSKRDGDQSLENLRVWPSARRWACGRRKLWCWRTRKTASARLWPAVSGSSTCRI